MVRPTVFISLWVNSLSVPSLLISRGVVVNFDLGERFPRPRSQQRGSLRPRARRVAVLGVRAGGGRPFPLRGSGGVTAGKFLKIFDA